LSAIIPPLNADIAVVSDVALAAFSGLITDHPVEQGSTISDHAYKLPLELSITYAWSGASPQNVGTLTGLTPRLVIPKLDDGSQFLISLYQDLIKLQEEVVLLDIFTGKRIYNNMLIKTITTFSDKVNEHVLVVNMVCREIIMAKTRVVALSTEQRHQLFPDRTQDLQNNGSQQPQPAQTVNPDGVDKSIDLGDLGS
jgi:hypothetical protein